MIFFLLLSKILKLQSLVQPWIFWLVRYLFFVVCAHVCVCVSRWRKPCGWAAGFVYAVKNDLSIKFEQKEKKIFFIFKPYFRKWLFAFKGHFYFLVYLKKLNSYYLLRLLKNLRVLFLKFFLFAELSLYMVHLHHKYCPEKLLMIYACQIR